MGEKGEHEQTEKHINPKLCAEIERTCAHLLLQGGGGSTIFFSEIIYFSSLVQVFGAIIQQNFKGYMWTSRFGLHERQVRTSSPYFISKRNIAKVMKSRIMK